MIFERLQVQGIGHDIMSFNSTISTCQVDGKNWQQSLLMFQSLNEVDMDPNLITCNAVLSGCGKKAGEWHQALVLFESIPTIRVERDVISYNAQIASVQGAWKESLILFGQMSEKLMEPNIITYKSDNLFLRKCQSQNPALPFLRKVRRVLRGNLKHKTSPAVALLTILLALVQIWLSSSFETSWRFPRGETVPWKMIKNLGMVGRITKKFTSSSRASRGGSFRRKKLYTAKKEFACRMCARRPTSAMPKPFLCCEGAFCCSMVVM